VSTYVLTLKVHSFQLSSPKFTSHIDQLIGHIIRDLWATVRWEGEVCLWNWRQCRRQLKQKSKQTAPGGT